MPVRKTILATGETYHILNRSLRGEIFSDKWKIRYFLFAAKYYLQLKPPVKFSRYRKQQKKYQTCFDKTIVKILAYCVMPTHFHFILTQLEENGVQNYIKKLCSSFAHYYNIKHDQRGPVFEGIFKAIRVKDQDQLIHLSRYIHLNPVTDYLVEDPKDYEFSSHNTYLQKTKNNFIDTSTVMSSFKSTEDYEKFVLDRKDYQRELHTIKKLVFE